jgi:predicted TIM-barrel fold metal-dependent hydrolase
MAQIPFVDTHVHFFDMRQPRLRYSWLEEESDDNPAIPLGAMRARRYWPDDYLAETRFHNVRKVVHVEAATDTPDPVEETAWLQAFADRLDVPHGIVAALDLARTDVAEQLDRHTEFRNLRGIRDLRDDDYLSSVPWRRGVKALERHGGLVLCIMPPPELAAVARELAVSHPGVTVCIDHAGFPRDRSDEYFDRWRTGIRILAEAENTVIKMSGLAMADHRWTVDSIRPWVLECIAAFGVERACFGTNWPLDRLWSSYGDVIDAYAGIISQFRPDEQHALFAGNAERIFRI